MLFLSHPIMPSHLRYHLGESWVTFEVGRGTLMNIQKFCRIIIALLGQFFKRLFCLTADDWQVQRTKCGRSFWFCIINENFQPYVTISGYTQNEPLDMVICIFESQNALLPRFSEISTKVKAVVTKIVNSENFKHVYCQLKTNAFTSIKT